MSAGICVDCGTRPATAGRAFCSTCAFSPGPERVRVVPTLREGGPVRDGVHHFPPGTFTAFDPSDEKLIAALDWAGCDCKACREWVGRSVATLKQRGYSMAATSIPLRDYRPPLGLPKAIAWVSHAGVRARHDAIIEEALTGRVDPRFSWQIVRDLWRVIDHLTGREKL